MTPIALSRRRAVLSAAVLTGLPLLGPPAPARAEGTDINPEEWTLLDSLSDGFDAPLYFGSEHNDTFCNDHGRIATRTNYSGGIQGGISNGEDIYFRVAFKAVATLLREQQTVDRDGRETIINAKGRHDPCVLPRAVPLVEAMAAMTILDYLLLMKSR